MANAQQMEMAEEIHDLKSKMDAMKGWITEVARYKLINPWGNGSLVYALRNGTKKRTSTHRCTKCFEDGSKSLLNPLDDVKGWCFLSMSALQI